MDRGDMPISAREWMGIRQLRAYASVSERTLRSWIHSPVDPLPAVRVGGKILVKRSELDLWLERHRIKALDRIGLDDIVKDVLQGLTLGR
jgi:excisionase family DNA binding protein